MSQEEEIREIYESTLSKITGSQRKARLEVEFFSFVGINNTIRLRDGVICVKISDLLQNAPLEFHEVLSEILIRKFYRKKVPMRLSKAFRDYINLPEVRQMAVASRKRRGRKALKGAIGRHFNLEKIFDSINQKYFQNAIPKPTLTWSANKTYRMLGRYDSTHQTITISKSLDEDNVPPFVLMFVVYHEMLHIKHPTQYKNGRRYSHTTAFRREEKKFELYDEAEAWIENVFTAANKRTMKSKKGFIRKLFNF